MPRLTIATLATAHPDFRITVREVRGRRFYHVDHGPSRLGSACTLTSLNDVESVIRFYPADKDNRGYWRPECFLASVDLPAGEVTP